jgi:hypothetical protein
LKRTIACEFCEAISELHEAHPCPMQLISEWKEQMKIRGSQVSVVILEDAIPLAEFLLRIVCPGFITSNNIGQKTVPTIQNRLFY